MRILVAENLVNNVGVLTDLLTRANMPCSTVTSGQHILGTALLEAKHGRQFDAAIIHANTPDLPHSHVIAQARQQGQYGPIIMVASTDDPKHRIEAVEKGVDDYLLPNTPSEEVVARVRALIRRARIANGHPHIAFSSSVGNLSINKGAGQFHIDGVQLILPSKLHVYLETLFDFQNQVITKEVLTNLDEAGASHESIDVNMSRLRKFLDRADAGVSIKPVYGRGYVLSDNRDRRKTTIPIISSEIDSRQLSFQFTLSP